MREVNLDEASEMSNLIKSKLEDTPRHSPQPQTFSYTTPTFKEGKSRAIVRLVTTDILLGLVQVFKSGGEVTMHSHTGMDGFWLVLGGRARFYFEGGETVEVGRHDGVCTPRDCPYWFESVGEQPLEILQVDAIHPGLKNRVTMSATDEAASQDRIRALDLYDARK